MEQDKIDFSHETQFLTRDSGYSEEEQAFAIDIQSGNLNGVKQHGMFRQKNRGGKCAILYQTISNRLTFLVSLYCQQKEEHYPEADQVLTEIEKLRMIQDILLKAVVWEHNGILDESIVPEEIWEMLA